MAKVTYTPDASAGCSAKTSQYGYHFEAGKPVEVTDEKHLAKFAGNPHFKVVADGKTGHMTKSA